MTWPIVLSLCLRYCQADPIPSALSCATGSGPSEVLVRFWEDEAARWSQNNFGLLVAVDRSARQLAAKTGQPRQRKRYGIDCRPTGFEINETGLKIQKGINT